MAKRRTLKRGARKVPTFIQENDFYCGPATAKMVLRWLKVTRSQSALWDLILAATNTLGLSQREPCLGDFTYWSTRPEPLAKVIKDLSGADIKLVSETTAAATDHAVVWSILQDIPAVALVDGANHWIVVHGYHVSREPANINDTNYQLLGFDIIDSNRPQKARDYVSASAWRSNYMNGVVCGKFDGKFVAVCDPEPTRVKGGPTVSRTPQKREPSGGLLRAERLSRMAFEGVRLAGLLEDETWKKAMNGVSTGGHCLVHRLDRLNSFYAIVPFEKGGRVQAQAMLDPYTGELLGAGASEDLGKSLSMPTTTDDAINRVAGKYFDLPGEHPHLRLKREGLSASPTLVWQPCRESLTPYLPFTQVTYGKHTLYVRTDGKVFTSLTTPRRGS
jgi:hypothetical protein